MQIYDFLVAVVVVIASVHSRELGSLRFDDGNVNDNEWKKNNRAARAARFLEQCFGRSLPNDDLKFSYLRFWRQRELAGVNLSFFAFTWKPFLPNKQKFTSPIFL